MNPLLWTIIFAAVLIVGVVVFICIVEGREHMDVSRMLDIEAAEEEGNEVVEPDRELPRLWTVALGDGRTFAIIADSREEDGCRDVFHLNGEFVAEFQGAAAIVCAALPPAPPESSPSQAT